MRSTLHVFIDTVNHCAFVRGYKAYDYIVYCGGRPLWSRRRKAWSTSEHTARDVIAMADGEGITVSDELIERDAG